MMQNAVNESFWDAQNVEIEGRSIFEKKSNFLEKSSPTKQIAFLMLWVRVDHPYETIP